MSSNSQYNPKKKMCQLSISFTRDKNINLRALLITFVFLFTRTELSHCLGSPANITAVVGGNAIFNCSVELPIAGGESYGFRWNKKDKPVFYFWHQNSPWYTTNSYKNRVTTTISDSSLGAASLNLTNVKESDEGWYQCQIIFSDNPQKWETVENGTWFYLHVRGALQFIIPPPDFVYVNWGDKVNISCKTSGKTTAEIQWYRSGSPVINSTVAEISSDGTQLVLPNIQFEDTGAVTCVAESQESRISHTAIILASASVEIIITPKNLTKVEGDRIQFKCQAKGLPANATTEWLVRGMPLDNFATSTERVVLEKDGFLIIDPVNELDTGLYTCRAKGFSKLPSALAYLNVEYPARVEHSPKVQYLTFGLNGVLNCYTKSNPSLEYVTWTKDKRLLELFQSKDITLLNNGSLLFAQVKESYEGEYTCTPYNSQGTQGSSALMRVIVQKLPAFSVKPKVVYQSKIGGRVQMHCASHETENTQIKWMRADGSRLPNEARYRITRGNITIENVETADFGLYKCVLSNNVGSNVTTTQLVLEGTEPYAPYNLTATPSSTSIMLRWLPGYNGQPNYQQDYFVTYRAADEPKWSTIPVPQFKNTEITVDNLSPNQLYELQVGGTNLSISRLLSVKTLDIQLNHQKAATTTTTTTTDLPGFKYDPPNNVMVSQVENGSLISWEPPAGVTGLIDHYTIKYRTDGPYKILNRRELLPDAISYLVKNLVSGRVYYFQIWVYFNDNTYGISDEIRYMVPPRSMSIRKESKPLARITEILCENGSNCSSSSFHLASKKYLIASIISVYFAYF